MLFQYIYIYVLNDDIPKNIIEQYVYMPWSSGCNTCRRFCKDTSPGMDGPNRTGYVLWVEAL